MAAHKIFLVIMASLMTLSVLISANIVIPFERKERHDQQQVVQDRKLFSSTTSFPLKGHLGGAYYSLKLRLGSPSKEFTLHADTGSDDLWVSCKSCNGCPNSSKNSGDRELSIFDPAKSSTASILSCSDKLCSHCSENNQCTYELRYGDTSHTSGYYVKDMLLFDKAKNSSAPFVFGCSTYCNSKFSSMGVDGLIGLGRGNTSFISQLSASHKIPKVFSHCLREDGSGGVLVFGKVLKALIVYSPLVPSGSDYVINLDSISVGKKELPIYNQQGKYWDVIVDSGSYEGFLVKELYDPFVDAIHAAVSADYATPTSPDKICYNVFNSNRTVDKIFPPINYKFKGGLNITLNPKEYLVMNGNGDGYNYWCILFGSSDSLNILGDIFFRNKIVEYDLEKNRIGIANYNCSLPIYVDPQVSSARSISKLQMIPLSLYILPLILPHLL